MNAGIVALKGALRKLELNGNGEMLWTPTAPPVPVPHFEDANIITALFQLFWKEQPPYYHAHVKVLLVSEQLAGQTATLRMLREGESCGAMQPARAW